MNVLVGTSGYSYPPWRGVFYPEDLPAAGMLGFYATRLPAVEINNTFYRMPAAATLERWSAETPPGFVFALKSPRVITHERRLADTDEPLGRLAKAAAGLGAKLGPMLFQLPPFFRKDVGRLGAFLESVRRVWGPEGPGVALEFRHPSWMSDEVYETLKRHHAALVVADTDEGCTPLEGTADWGYLRLRRRDYGPEELGAWARRLAAQPWRRAYVFFKHEDEGRGPALALDLIRQLEQGPGAQPAPGEDRAIVGT